MPSAEQRVVILIPSCTAYHDALAVTLEGIRKFGYDALAPVVVASTGFPEDWPSRFPGFRFLDLGVDRGWSSNVTAALDRIQADWAIVWIDDLVPVAPPAPIVGAAIAACHAGRCTSINALKFGDGLRPMARRRGPLRVLAPTTPYRVSTVIVLYRVPILRRLLIEGENAWQFETRGGERAKALDGFFITSRKAVDTANLVLKGRLLPRAVRKAASAGLDYLGARGALPLRRCALLRAKEAASAATYHFAPSLMLRYHAYAWGTAEPRAESASVAR